ncbi:MAG: hypothetical protein AAB738_01815 [Patescibacteria group bacterium]
MNSSKYLVLVLVLAITIFTVWGDSFLKKAGNHINFFLNREFLLGFVIYAATAFLWVFVYKYAKFSISGAIYSVLSLITFVVLGVGMFGEKLTGIEVVGLGMGVGSLVILSKFI